MSSYNWIEAEGTCPACGEPSIFRTQTHVASSYEGDEQGCFFDRTYKLGEPMAWWPQTDDRYELWSEHCDPKHCSPLREACYCDCTRCGAGLCVVIEFENLRATRIVQASRESEWPDRYERGSPGPVSRSR